MKPLLISLHLPKTAGTSFSAVLTRHFGDRLYRDYEDRPLNQPSLARKLHAAKQSLANRKTPQLPENADCVHGHFLPLKYRWMPTHRPTQFVVWLREPVTRLASHFRYWQQSYAVESAGPLHRRVVEENWSFERFCFSSELRNTYCQFLWGFPIQRFQFVGLTECFEQDIQRFADRFDLQSSADMPRENIGGGDDSSADESREAIAEQLADAGFRDRIERFHAKDVALYASQLAARRRRGEPVP